MLFLPPDWTIENARDAKYFLASLGMNKFEIEEFCEILTKDTFYVDWKQEAKEWENDSMEQFEKRNGLITDMLEIVDCLINGKGTKAQLAARIKECCDFWY